MLICLPTKGNAGLDDIVNEHFGSAPYFTLVDTETGEVKILSNVNEHHSHGTCHPMAQLANHKIDRVVCGGMGRRAIQMLNHSGIAVFRSSRASVREIIEQVKNGELVEMDPATACAGHGIHHAGHGSRGGGISGGGSGSDRGSGGGPGASGRGVDRSGNGGGRQGRTGSGARGRRGRNR